MAITNVNENLRFNDTTRTLSSQKIPHKSITLGVAATFCLSALLDAKGHIVSQERLINEGWRKHGLEVSPGNVRQVVSQIRRAFLSLKESPALLVTVPKLGYRLEIPTDLTIPDNITNPLENETPNSLDSPVSTQASHHAVVTPQMGWVLGINVVLAAFFFYWTQFYPVPHANYTAETAPWPKVHLQVDNDLLKDRNYIASSLAILKQSPNIFEENKNLPWIYLNGNLNKKVHSFFLCSHAITDPQAYCKSRIFSEE